MANSLLHFHNKSLWMDDSSLRIIIYYLAPMIKKALDNDKMTEKNKKWLDSYYHDRLIFDLEWMMTGGINLKLEEVFEDPYRINLFVSSLNEVKKILYSVGSELSTNELDKVDSWVVGESISNENPKSTHDLIANIDLILGMLPTIK